MTLRADDYYFAPDVPARRPGQPLRLRVENAAGTLHNLCVPALGIDRDLPPLARVDLEVVVPAAGPVPSSASSTGRSARRGNWSLTTGSYGSSGSAGGARRLAGTQLGVNRARRAKPYTGSRSRRTTTTGIMAPTRR